MTRVGIPEHVEYTVVDGKALVLDTEAGTSIELDEVGTLIWELVADRRDADEVARSLLRDYQVSEEVARSDLDAFLHKLIERGYLVAVE